MKFGNMENILPIEKHWPYGITYEHVDDINGSYHMFGNENAYLVIHMDETLMTSIKVGSLIKSTS
jgi:hypothetical protein